LFHVEKTGRTARTFARSGKDGQQARGDDRYDRYYDQKFDEGEARPYSVFCTILLNAPELGFAEQQALYPFRSRLKPNHIVETFYENYCARPNRFQHLLTNAARKFRPLVGKQI
jgi:hypothetical protein